MRSLRVQAKSNCSYLLTYALLETHDQILTEALKGNDRGMDLSEVVLSARNIPTWAELAG